MAHLRPAIAAAILLAGCAADDRRPPVDSSAAKPPPAAEPAPAGLLADRFIMPGERAGPISLRMTLRNLTTAMGEPVSSSAIRLPGGQAGLLYRYPDAEQTDAAALVSVRESDQSVQSVRIERSEAWQTREGVRAGSSDALVRAAFGTPGITLRNPAGQASGYCYANGLMLQMDDSGNVDSITIFPTGELRRYCR